jgi:hypothetical protein
MPGDWRFNCSLTPNPCSAERGERSVRQNTKHGKSRPDFDLYGMSGAARQVGRTPDTARAYAKKLYAEGAAGVLKIDNGDYVCDERGIEALRGEAMARALRR